MQQRPATAFLPKETGFIPNWPDPGVTVIRSFYVVLFSIVHWCGNLGIKQRNGLENIVKIANRIVGTQFNNMSHIFNMQVLNKARSIHSDSAQPLFLDYKLLSCDKR